MLVFQQDEGILTYTETSAFRDTYKAFLESELASLASTTFSPPTDMFGAAKWSKMKWSASKDAMHYPETGVEEDVLLDVGRASVAIPEEFVSKNVLETTKVHIII